MLWNGTQFDGGVSFPQIGGFQNAERLRPRIEPDVMPVVDVIDSIPTLPGGKPAVFEQTASGLRIRCDCHAGVLEIVDPRMLRTGRETFCRVLSASAIGISGASSVDLDLLAHSCRFHFEPCRFDEAELARRVLLAIDAATAAVRLEAAGFFDGWMTGDSSRNGSAIVEKKEEEPPGTIDSDRLLFVALGCGSLVAGFAGLIVPGIPAAPFFLFAAHYFMRSSTTIERWLDGMPKVPEVVRKFEASRGTPLDGGFLGNRLAMIVLVGLLSVTIHPPLPLVIAIELGMMLFFGLRELGELEPLSGQISEIFA